MSKTMEREFTEDIKPCWAPHVRKEKIRRLYELDAQGLVDEDLIAEVGISILLRCQSILTVTEAHEGRARCPRCGEIIPHLWKKSEVLLCSGCGWKTTWGAYLKTYQDKHLHGGGALFAFQAYVENYERAQSAQERMLLIDRLLHAFHCELAGMYMRPAACNLIEGKIGEVVTFLDNLTYGERSASPIKQGYTEWCVKAERGGPFIRESLDLSRARRRCFRDGD